MKITALWCSGRSLQSMLCLRWPASFAGVAKVIVDDTQMDEKEGAIVFTENSHETMRRTAEGHDWFLCDHGWRYCVSCGGWPCGEPKKVKTYCEECAEVLASQFRPPPVSYRWMWGVVFFLTGVWAGMVIAS